MIAPSTRVYLGAALLLTLANVADRPNSGYAPDLPLGRWSYEAQTIGG